MDAPLRVRNVVLALLGAVLLVLKPRYQGPGSNSQDLWIGVSRGVSVTS
jgi:hypothetical protein